MPRFIIYETTNLNLLDLPMFEKSSSSCSPSVVHALTEPQAESQSSGGDGTPPPLT